MSVRTLGAVVVLVTACALATPAAAQDAPEPRSGAAVGISGLLDRVEGGKIPRTPWGTPDLRGVWNNSSRTPLERRTAAEIERGQLAQAPVIEATRGTGAGWVEQVTRGRPRGAHRRPARRPHPGAAARGAAAAHRPRERARGARRGRFVARSQLLGALHHAHAAHRHDPEHLQRKLPDLPDAGPRGGAHGDDPRGAHHPARRPPARRRRRPPVAGRQPRPLGGRHAGGRNRALQQPARRRRAPAVAHHPDHAPGSGRHPAPRRALPHARCEHDRLPLHRGGSGDLRRGRSRSRCR